MLSCKYIKKRRHQGHPGTGGPDFLCAWSVWLWWSAVLEEAAEIHLAFKVGLGSASDIGEDARIFIPCFQSSMIFATVLVIDDKGNYLMAQAFFDHDQSAKTAVAVLKGVDLLEADMEIQDILKRHDVLGLVFLD